MRRSVLSLVLPLLAVSSPTVGQEAPAPSDASELIMIPNPNSVVIPREELPFHVVLGNWVLMAGALVAKKPETAPPFLQDFGLDPSSEIVLAIGEIATGLSERMGPRELSRRYDEAEKTEVLTKRLQRDIQDGYRLDRAAFLGSAIGAWLAALEAEGVDTRKLVDTIFNDPHLGVSRSYDGDPHKLEMMHRANELFLARMEAELGHSFKEAEVRQ